MDRPAGVTDSGMPRLFLKDPIQPGWTSQPKACNRGLRWMNEHLVELTGG